MVLLYNQGSLFLVSFFFFCKVQGKQALSTFHPSLEMSGVLSSSAKACSDLVKNLRWSSQTSMTLYFLGIFSTFPEEQSEACSERCQTFKIKLFEKIVNGLKEYPLRNIYSQECLPKYVQVVLHRMIY